MEINLSNKIFNEHCTENAQILSASDKNGNKYFAKIINIQTSTKLGYYQCLEFNQEVLQDSQSLIFKEHFLQIKDTLNNQEMIGFVTDPYKQNLIKFIERQTINQKIILSIFDQILKAIYSLHSSGYWHRNIRAEHFVLVGNVWKLQSLIVSDDYSKANGVVNEYLWSSKHQAPQYVVGHQYTEEEFNSMVVWNLGCILLHLILGSHRLSNKDILQKFKGKPFTFETLNIKSDKISKLSNNLKEILGQMLHYDPLKRMTIKKLFDCKFLSEAVSNHFTKNNSALRSSKMMNFGSSSIKSKISPQSNIIMKELLKTVVLKAKQQQKILIKSKINSSIIDDDQFFDNLKMIKIKQQAKQKEDQIVSLQELMIGKTISIRKILQLYKSYYDQSQLLNEAIENIDKLHFNLIQQKNQQKELKLIIKYSIAFVSLLNLNLIAEAFNRNQNIYKLDADQFTTFQNTKQYFAFQKFVNFKRIQRIKIVDSFRIQLKKFKQSLLKIDKTLYLLVDRDYRTTTFQQIKVSYRLIVKYAYDSISEQYNRCKDSDQGQQLAQRAMFITYCLTVDKLYLKKHIPDNFSYYFKWIGQELNNYVPLVNFKKYILQADKIVLIDHSKYILKKYFDI